jgi:microcin C transport system permease protein
MSENTSKNNIIPRDDVPRDEIPEKGEMTGPLDVPQEDYGDNQPTLEDRFLARQSVPFRHMIPDTEIERAQPAQRQIREATGDASGTGQAPLAQKSLSVMQRRIRKFKSLKRGYYSFIILVVLYILSFFLPLLVNNQALAVHYKGSYYFPAFSDLIGTPYYPGTIFGQEGVASNTDFRKLDEQFEKEGGDNWVLMPLYTWDPLENDFESTESHPQAPSERHLFGTDDTGRDVFARMVYGFNVSISFSLMLIFFTYSIGMAIGGIMGYYGGKIVLIMQRFIEIWGVIPSLFVIIIVSSIIHPNFFALVGLLVVFGWMGLTYYMRGEFYREKAKDYVAAAISLGAKDKEIIFKHILPNALTPVIASFPFSIIGGISALVGLDFLGFGLPPPTPSWGQMVQVGLTNFSGNFQNWWLVLTPLGAMFATLLLVTFIGESIREAFDPKVFSRLR